jgi:hypothetical protein
VEFTHRSGIFLFDIKAGEINTETNQVHHSAGNVTIELDLGRKISHVHVGVGNVTLKPACI